MGPNQTYKLLHSKGNHKQNKRTTYGLEENAHDVTNKELILKYISSLYGSNKKPNNPVKKCAEELNRLFPKKTYRWPTSK